MNYPFNSVGEFSPENSVKSSLFYLSCEIRIIHSTMMKIKLPWGGKNGGKFNWKSALRMSWWNNKKKLYLILCWEWKSERANKTIHRTAKRNAIIAAFFASLPHSTFCLFCSFSELLMLSKLHQTPQHFFLAGCFFLCDFQWVTNRFSSTHSERLSITANIHHLWDVVKNEASGGSYTIRFHHSIPIGEKGRELLKNFLEKLWKDFWEGTRKAIPLRRTILRLFNATLCEYRSLGNWNLIEALLARGSFFPPIWGIEEKKWE